MLNVFFFFFWHSVVHLALFGVGCRVAYGSGVGTLLPVAVTGWTAQVRGFGPVPPGAGGWGEGGEWLSAAGVRVEMGFEPGGIGGLGSCQC